MDKQTLCKLHNKDIHEIREEIDKMKDSIYSFNIKLDDLFLKLKPPFTLKDKLGFLFGLLVYTVIITIAFSEVKSSAATNKENIKDLKEVQVRDNIRLEYKVDKIYDILLEIKKESK